MKQTITLYYDQSEREFGNGFYPITEYKKGMIETTVGFELGIDMYWRQAYVMLTNICGLDGDYGQKLLTILNSKDNGYTGIGIRDCFGRIIYPKSKSK